MTRFGHFLVGVLACGTGTAQGWAVEPSPLVGSWSLERYVDTPDGGSPYFAFGENPVGLFVFTADGYASFHLMRNLPAAEPAGSDPDPNACVPTWYCSYFGSYTYDAAGGRWITHVLGGNIPSYIGTDQPRSFRIEGERLIISYTYEADRRTVRGERVLVRQRPR